MKKLMLLISGLLFALMLCAQDGYSLANPISVDNLVSFRGQQPNYRYILATPATTGGSVWGTNWYNSNYTDDSNIHMVARHAFGIPIGEKCIISCEIQSGGNNYVGTTNNGVTSQNYGSWPGSYAAVSYSYLNTPTNASNAANSSVTTNSATITWTRGGGHRVAVFMKATTSAYAYPINYNSYTASTSFGTGSATPTGWYCVYNGTGSSVNVTNLSTGVAYTANIVEWNYPYTGYQTYVSGGLYNQFTTQAGVTYTSGSGFTPAITLGATAKAIGRFTLTPNVSGSTLTAAYIKINGVRSGLTNFKLWYSTDAVYGGDTQIGSNVAVDQGAGNTVSFSFSRALSVAANYFFVTCDVGAAAAGSITPLLASQASLTITGGALSSSFADSPLSSADVALLPLPAITPSPANGGTNLAITSTLSWVNATGSIPTGYKLYFGTDATPTNIVNGTNLGNVLTYTPVGGLQPNTLYYWKIVPTNALGDAAGNTVWSFTTLPVPGTAVISTPANTATGVALNATLNWTAPVSGGAVTGYKLYFGTDATPSNLVNGTVLGNVLSYTPTAAFSGNTVYYWQIVPYNGSGDATSCPIWSFTSLATPGSAGLVSPADVSTGIALDASLNWTAPASGGAPTGYTLYFGTDNPPLTAYDNGSSLTWSAAAPLLYSTVYYWQVIPRNTAGNTATCPVWSFTTTDQYVDNTLPPVDNGITTINPEIIISGVAGVFAPIITTGWDLAGTIFTSDGLFIQLANGEFGGRTIIINPGLGYTPTMLGYRVISNPEGTWNWEFQVPGWTPTNVYFTIPGVKADGDVDIIFPAESGGTLPVELSSFSAVLSNTGSEVQLSWTTESETGVSGYYIFRSETGDLQTAQSLNQLIPAVNSSTTYEYNYEDSELENTGTYFYWLQAIDIDGSSTFYGPVACTIHDTGEEIDPPVIPAQTLLRGIYPNPFNPVTNIAYSLKAGGTVQIGIYNLRGQRVHHATITHAIPGSYRYTWNADKEQLASGIYYVRMTCGSYKAAQKLVLSK